ncbi:MAG TPA: hypothetical protein VIL71_05435 [Spirillospora sp.]
MIPTWALRLVLAGALVVLVGAATPQGAVAVANVQYFLNFFAGVFALVSLTAAVVSGLLATERLILKIRHRVLAQAVHRAAAIVSVTMLIAHVTVKVMAGLAFPANIVVPTAGAVGLGTVAFDLMFVIVVSGLVRARFANRGKVWVWRTVHVLAYVAWPFAIVHGLTAGRAAANWVVLSYVMSVVFVVLALITRIIVVVKPRELNRIDDEIGAFSRPEGAGRRRDRRAMRAMEHEEARAAAAARARKADPLSALDDDLRGGDLRNADLRNADLRNGDPRGTVQDPQGMPVYGGGRDTEVYR